MRAARLRGPFLRLVRRGSPEFLHPGIARNLVNVRVWLALTALCFLTASGWILTEWRPETMPGLLPIALRSGLLVICFGVLDRVQSRSRGKPIPATACLVVLGYSVLVAGLPTLVLEFAGIYLSALSETLVFSFVPAFVVFFVSQGTADFGLRESPFDLFVPALMAIGGAALLLPFSIPSSGAGQAWLAALLFTAMASAWAAIQLHRRLRNMPIPLAAALFSAATFVVTIPVCVTQTGRLSSWSLPAVELEGLRSVLFDGPLIFLTVWLLRGVSPIAFSSRYPLTLALTIAEGYLLLRPETKWTTGLSLVLLLASGAWLVVSGFREVS